MGDSSGTEDPRWLADRVHRILAQGGDSIGKTLKGEWDSLVGVIQDVMLEMGEE